MNQAVIFETPPVSWRNDRETYKVQLATSPEPWITFAGPRHLADHFDFAADGCRYHLLIVKALATVVITAVSD